LVRAGIWWVLAIAGCSLRGTDDLQAGLSGGGGVGAGGGGGGSGGGGAPPCAGVDLDIDPGNCGACGHDCLGGDCVDGHCRPVMLFDVQAFGPDPPIFLSAYGGYVYFGHEIHVHRVRASDGDQTTVCSHSNAPLFIAAGESGVWFSNSNAGLLHAELDDSTVVCDDVTTFDDMQDPPWSGPLALDGSGIYMGRPGASPLYRASYLDLADPTMNPFYPFTIGQHDILSIATSERGHVAFSSMVASIGSATLTCVMPGGVYKLPKPPNDQPLALGTCAAQVATDGDDVYWTDLGAGTLVRSSFDSAPGEEVVLAGGQVAPLGIALDASHVYWTDAGMIATQTGAIRRLARTEGAVAEDMARNVAEPWLLTSDDTALYWVDRYTDGGQVFGRIMKLAK
jgi:hypothetical protein